MGIVNQGLVPHRSETDRKNKALCGHPSSPGGTLTCKVIEVTVETLPTYLYQYTNSIILIFQYSYVIHLITLLGLI